MTTEPYTLTDDDLRAMLAEVLHEHLAVRWVEEHKGKMSRAFDLLRQRASFGTSYLDAPGEWSVIIYLCAVTEIERTDASNVSYWWVRGSESTYLMYGPYIDGRYSGRCIAECPSWWDAATRVTTRAWLADFHARRAETEREHTHAGNL